MKWKYSRNSSFSCGVSILVALFAVIPPAAATAEDDDNYIPTTLVDPLQVVWDALDRLPGEVSNLVVPSVTSALETRLDAKLQAISKTLNTPLFDLTRRLIDLQHRQSVITTGDTRGNFAEDLSEAVVKLEGHIDSRLQELEAKLKEHIDSKFTLRNDTAILENINAHVIKINEKLGGSAEGGDSCSTLLDKVSELMGASGGGGGMVCPTVVKQGVSTSPGLLRDCSDMHWQQPQAPSGVYEIFPTLDHKDPVNTYCDMGQTSAPETGGWTVILRRRNTTFGLVNFNRTWDEYRRGFGDPGEGEWWFGLYFLHALTYRQPFEVDLLLHDIEKGTFHATYTTFRVEDESHDYKLVLSGFKGNLTHDALTKKHHGSPFTTWDKDNDRWGDGNCARSNGGGWWFDNCHFTTLTATFPTSSDRSARTIRWLEDDWLVLDDVTMKIRPFNYAQRFNTHSTD